MKKFKTVLILTTLLIFITKTFVVADMKNDSLESPVVQIGTDKYNFAKIRKLSGFCISGLIYGDKVALTISHENLNRNDSGKYDVEMKTVLSVTAKPTTTEKAYVKQVLSGLNSVNFKEITFAGSEVWDGKNLKKYNYEDTNHIVRLSEWYDDESGFKMKKAIYDENGKLVSFEMNSDVKFDQEANVGDFRIEHKRFDFDSVYKKYGYSKIDTMEDVARFADFVENDLNN